MPDSPDYSKYLTGSVRFSLQDMGELAARLGSVMVYDRRGEIAWADEFNYGLMGYTTGITGAGASVSLSVEQTFRSPFSAKLVTGNALNNTAQIGKSFGMQNLGVVGLEIYIASTSHYLEWILFLSRNSNLVEYDARMKLVNTGGAIQIYDGTGTYQTIGTFKSIVSVNGDFYPIKLVVDFDNAKYKRLLIGSSEFDISNYSVSQGVGGSEDIFGFTVRLVSDTTSNRTGYLSRVIITSNEP